MIMQIYGTEFYCDKNVKDLKITDITKNVESAVRDSKVKNGIIAVFVEGSTASISTMEYEPNLEKDIKNAMEKITPSGIEYEHHKTWGDFNGKSHVRATLLGPSVSLPIKNGKIPLGTWQQIVLLDFDVPDRKRKVHVQIVGE